jgi:hypothetical protein
LILSIYALCEFGGQSDAYFSFVLFTTVGSPEIAFPEIAGQLYNRQNNHFSLLWTIMSMLQRGCDTHARNAYSGLKILFLGSFCISSQFQNATMEWVEVWRS